MDRTSPLAHLLLRILTLTLTALATSPATAATTLYRCGETYQQMPCAGGTAMRIVDDRTSEQKSQAESQQDDEMRLAQSMRQQRLNRERQAAKSAPSIGNLGPVSPSKSDKLTTAKAHNDDCSPRKSGQQAANKHLCNEGGRSSGQETASKSRRATAHQTTSEQARAQQPSAGSGLKSPR